MLQEPKSQKTQEIPAEEVALLLAMCQLGPRHAVHHGVRLPVLSSPLSDDVYDALVTVGQRGEE